MTVLKKKKKKKKKEDFFFFFFFGVNVKDLYQAFLLHSCGRPLIQQEDNRASSYKIKKDVTDQEVAGGSRRA